MSELIIMEAKPEEMDEIYQLRYHIFCEELKFLSSNDYPNGRERDKYDERSHHIVVTKNNQIVGYSRLILPRDNEKFPIEEAVKLPAIFELRSAVEVSRGIVTSQERGSGVKQLLMKAVFDYCRNNGFKLLLSFSNQIMFEGWKKAGVEFLFMGDCVKYHGFDTWPLIINIDKTFMV